MIINWIHKMFLGSLRRQLILGVAIVNTVMMGWFVMDATHRQEVLFLDRQAEQATALAEALATASNHWLAANDISGLQELIEAQRRYPELRFAMLLDNNGRILAHTDRSHIGQYVQDLPGRAQQAELVHNKTLVDVVVPAMMSGRHVGWARIGVGQQMAGKKAAEITHNGMLYAFFAILLASLIAWLMAKRLTRRLSHIQTVMEEVRSGNNRARSLLGGIDEAADLSTGFNTMLDTLEEEMVVRQIAQELLQEQTILLETEIDERCKAQDKLKQLNDELELRIQERTVMVRQQEWVNLLQQSLLKPTSLESKLSDITDGIVRYFNADFCRIWMIRPGDLCAQGCTHAEDTDGEHVCNHRNLCLHLLASSGRYTHLDGKMHRRVPFGCYKIGLIASGEGHRFLTNDVEHEHLAHNHEWARNLGLVSFAGYQLRVPGGDSIGVLALFSKRPISTSEDALLDGLSSAVALTAQQAATEDALHLQTVELEEEVAERQMTQESLQEQATRLEEEVEKRQETQHELEILNENLEQRVEERTLELNERNIEVQQAYDDLKAVQAQLLQQDKMASVGQLAAGVAHEINNPMGFIISNLGSLSKYVEKLTAYLDADEKVLAGCDPATREKAAQERQKYKIAHICRDLPELIAESSEGAQRVRQIVQDLKSFSHVDSGEFAAADINDGLDSTLSIAWNELKYKTTVTKEYGDLPHVWCNMGQLNQVFLNILVNAAHAIVDHGEIRIKTLEDNGKVLIAISDTGSGIKPENVKRIFDPFFTTKEVGKGTGLGLAIAYDIITNKHGGTIEVQSELGVGTMFTITLPVKKTNSTEC